MDSPRACFQEGKNMDVQLQAKDGPLASLPEQIADITARLNKEQITWRDQLRQDPSQFGDVEVAVHRAFQQLADQVVAGLLADVGQQSPKLEDDAKKSR
jgi:hypothetical protein